MDVPGFALVTGAASGIGKACAKAFALEGSAGVALLDINEEALEATRQEIEAELAKRQENKPDQNKCRILAYTVNVTDEEQVNRVVSEVATTFGRLDYVLNGAGVAAKCADGAAFAETAEWTRVMDINLNGIFFVLKAAAQVMLKQEPILSSISGRPLQRGSIVNIASVLGLVAIPMYTSYVASKHAIVGLTKSASLDYAQKGLRINAICPGYTDTAMTTGPDIQQAMEATVKTFVPMARMGLPQEIADGVLFLAGGRSSFVTGSTLTIDGGYTTR